MAGIVIFWHLLLPNCNNQQPSEARQAPGGWDSLNGCSRCVNKDPIPPNHPSAPNWLVNPLSCPLWLSVGHKNWNVVSKFGTKWLPWHHRDGCSHCRPNWVHPYSVKHFGCLEKHHIKCNQLLLITISNRKTNYWKLMRQKLLNAAYFFLFC